MVMLRPLWRIIVLPNHSLIAMFEFNGFTIRCYLCLPRLPEIALWDIPTVALPLRDDPAAFCIHKCERSPTIPRYLRPNSASTVLRDARPRTSYFVTRTNQRLRREHRSGETNRECTSNCKLSNAHASPILLN
jgi:hypothetical protein